MKCENEHGAAKGVSGLTIINIELQLVGCNFIKDYVVFCARFTNKTASDKR